MYRRLILINNGARYRPSPESSLVDALCRRGSTKTWQLVLVFAAAFIGAQRFILPAISAYLCVVPLLVSLLIFNTNRPVRNALLVISLFLSVDNGGEVFQETTSVVRYLIYLVAIVTMVEGFRPDTRRIVVYAGFLIFPISLAILNADLIDRDTLVRDVETAILIGIVFCRKRGQSVRQFNIDLDFVTVFLLGYLLAEVINHLFFFSISIHQYLNYSSTKSLLAVVPFIFLTRSKNYFAMVLVLATLVVLFGYTTRMILLTFMLVLIGWLISKLRGLFLLKTVTLALALTVPIMLFSNNISNLPLEASKFTNFLLKLATQVDSIEELSVLDPVRFGEWVLFFERDLFQILFGSGFGSGLVDDVGMFSFVPDRNTAFSAEELESGVFYNLHDIWTDVGLRFGLLPLAIVFIPIIRNLYSKKSNRSFYAMSLFVIMNCAFFSTAGLLLIASFWLAFQDVIQTGDPSRRWVSDKISPALVVNGIGEQQKNK